MANKHQYDVRITFQITKAGTGFKEVQNEIVKTDAVNKKASKSIIGKWTELRSQLLLVKFAIAEVSNAFNAVWSAARGGAGLTQLTESFERANSAIFKTPTLLNDMSVAARGTITEAELMSGIMTLTAGTSKELSQALTSNAADLLTIAKAANRLNPTLGDTDFFYKSLTQGIKRSSYRILDNLGIVVRVGEANKNWAAQMGRTVESLSAEERQMALLNEVLNVGGRLVAQAGGEAGSLTDAYDILSTAGKELGNTLKQGLNSIIYPLIKGFAEARLKVLEFQQAIDSISFSGAEKDVEDYIRELNILQDKLAEEYSVGGAGRPGKVQKSIVEELAEILLDIDPALKDLEQAQRGFLGLFVASGDSERRAANFEQIIEAAIELAIVTEDGTIKFGNQVIAVETLEFALLALTAAQEKAREEEAKMLDTERFASQQAAAVDQQLRTRVALSGEVAKADKARRIEAGLTTGLEVDSLGDYIEAVAGASYAEGEYLKNNDNFINQMRSLGIEVDHTGVSLGETSYTWRELTDAVKGNIVETEAATKAAALLTAQEESLVWAGMDVAAGMDLMAARAENWANEAAGAAREVADELERLEEVELSNFFDQAASGDINFFNKELDELGTHMTWVSDSTVLQTDQVANLQKEYADITQTINDYNTFATGATLTDDERNKKIAEQYELLGVVGGKLSEVGELQGHYAEYVTQSVIDQDKLNDSMYDAIAAYSENAAETSRAGVALGIYNEEAAYQILQNALLAQGIERIAAEYGEGGKSVAWLTEQMRLLKEEVLSAPNPADAIDMSTLDTTAFLWKNKDMGLMEESLKVEIPPPDTTLFDTYMITEFPEGEKKLDIVISTNAEDILLEQLTPFKTEMDAIVLASPYEADLDTNTAVEKTLLESYGLYFFGLDGKSVTTTITTNFVENNKPAPYNPFPGPGNATGADYIVPPGYPNESWSIGTASTGERVKIDTPAQQRAEGKNNNGLTVQFLGPVYGEDALMERIEESYAQKGRMAYNRSRGG